MYEKTMLIKMNQQINGTPNFQILSEDQREQIYFAALDVLEISGGRVLDQEAIALFEESDAVVTDGDRVRIPTTLVEEARQGSPSKTTLTGRNGKRSVKVQKNEVAFGSAANPRFIYDHNTGEHRETTFADVEAAAKMVDYLPRLDFCMSHGQVSNAPRAETSDRHQFLAMIKNCTKPLIVTSTDVSGLRDQQEMACMITGGEKEFQLSPLFATHISSPMPLVYSNEVVNKLLYAADQRIPVIYNVYSGLGVSAPASIAGALVQTLADFLLTVVMCYLKKPGMPLVLSSTQTLADKENAAFYYGSPELHLTSAAMAEICRWLGLMSACPGGCTDSKAVDQQAASEAVMSIYNGFMAGTNLIHHIGCLEGGLNGSLPHLVMCDEIIGMIEQIGRGIEVTDETLALDVLQEVGPAGEFLTHVHTYDFFREWFRPTVIDRSTYEIWEENGSKNYNERLDAEVQRILEAHQPEPLDEKMIQEMKKIIDMADKKEV
jgi:trimethylamine--corrinoid protein Co-methyltransferase